MGSEGDNWAEKKAFELLNAYTKPTKYSAGWEFPIGLIVDIEKALEAAVARAVEEERERCCKAICGMCADGWTLGRDGGLWIHTQDTKGIPAGLSCNAAALRARASREKG